jgi:hypothetical protein
LAGVLTAPEKSLQSRFRWPFIATTAEFERKIFSLRSRNSFQLHSVNGGTYETFSSTVFDRIDDCPFSLLQPTNGRSTKIG